MEDKPSIFNTVTLIILLLIIIGGISFSLYQKPQKQISFKESQKKIAKQTETHSISKPQETVLGNKTTATKTYASVGGYTVVYPRNWIPDEVSQINGFSGSTQVFMVGPIGSKVTGYPSFIQIAVDDNSKGLQLDSYLANKFDSSIHFNPISVGEIAGMETTDVPGQTTNEIIFTQHNGKIFQIRFFDGTEPKITRDEFQQFLQQMTFQ